MPQKSEYPRSTIQFKVTQYIFWAGALFLIVWLLYKNFVPGGTFVIHYNVDTGSSFIRNFASKERDRVLGTKNTKDASEFFQLITTTPLYFTVKAPRPFPKAEISLVYQNPDGQAQIQLGSLHNLRKLQDMAMYNPFLENMPEEWQKIQEGETVLWQKNNEYIKEKKKNNEAKELEKTELTEEEAGELASLSRRVSRGDMSYSEFDSAAAALREQYQQKKNEIDFRYQGVERPPLRYQTIGDFLKNPPDSDVTLQFNHRVNHQYLLPGYEARQEMTTIEKSLRGPHEIAAYVGRGEALSFRFLIQDINRHAGKDDFQVEVWKGDQKLFAEGLTSLGTDVPTNQPSAEAEVHVAQSDLVAGVYRLKILTNDDIFIKQIETQQHLFMFSKGLYIAENVDYQNILGDKKLSGTTIVTNSEMLSAVTAHESGLQTIRVNDTSLSLDREQIAKELTDLRGPSTITMSLNDVQLDGDGFFAFSEEQLFDLEKEKINYLTDTTDLGKFDYIIANYHPAEKEGDWLVAKASIAAPDLAFVKNEADLFFAFPDLPESNRTLRVKELRITLSKPPLSIFDALKKITAKTKELFQIHK